MVLVDYSSSSSESDQSIPKLTTSSKRKHSEVSSTHEQSLPPLPAAFRDLYASNARIGTDDDPALHGGRQRAVPHVEGNWPTHVYLEWFPSPTETKPLRDMIEAVRQSLPSSSPKLHSLLNNDLGVPLPLHVSLSASLVLQTERKDAFLDAITASIKRRTIRTTDTNVKGPDSVPLQLRLSGVEWALNAEGTRSFLVLRIMRPKGDELNELLAASNEVAAMHDLPTLYLPQGSSVQHKRRATNKQARQDGNRYGISEAKGDAAYFADSTDRFHFSIGWDLNGSANYEQAKSTLKVPPEVLQAVLGLKVEIDAVKVKIGNMVKSIPLTEEQNGSRGMLG